MTLPFAKKYAMLPRELTNDIIKRLHYVKGQLDGIERMLKEDGDPDKIIIQFKAVGEGVSKAHFLLLDEVLRKGLALKLVEVMNACPGNCGEAARIEFLKRKFPELGLDEITRKIKEVDEINRRMRNEMDNKEEENI